MNQFINAIKFGVGFAIGNRTVDHYKDIVDGCMDKIDTYLNINVMEKRKK